MTFDELILHERAGMMTRRLRGYGQHDDHVWRWLNYHLTLWCDAHPIKVRNA